MPATPAQFCFRPPNVVSLFRHPVPPLLLFPVLASLLLLALPPASASAQVVSGQVLDATTGDSIPLAEVTLLDTVGAVLHTVLADRQGYFTVSPPAGRYALRATALGYDTTSTRLFDLDVSEAMQVRLSLGVRALKLAPLNVVARQRDMRWRDLHEYYDRVERHRRLHIGWIVTRDDLEPVNVWKFGEYMRRAAPLPFSAGARCAPAYYWNGVYQIDTAFLYEVSIYHVEGIEFYRDFGPADIRFSDPNGCGVVLVWSRPLTDARRFTMRNLLLASGGFIASALLLHWVLGVPLRIF
ncbi:MAG: carboxypeptidase-like regulatory domain-containing protein [Gemmatimonadota bacterium]|jgi:hypothetical protein